MRSFVNSSIMCVLSMGNILINLLSNTILHFPEKLRLVTFHNILKMKLFRKNLWHCIINEAVCVYSVIIRRRYGQLFSVWAVTVTALVCLLKFRYVGPVTFLLAFMFWTLPVYAIYFLFDNMELFTSFLFRNHLLVEQPIRLAGLSQRLVNEGLEFMRNATDNDLPFLLVMSWVHMHVAIETSMEFHGMLI